MAAFTCQRLLKINSLARCHIDSKVFLSAAAAVEEKLPRFRTSENDPTRHNVNHIGKYYLMPNVIKEKIFLTGGISTTMKNLIDPFRECAVLIRNPAIEAISYLNQMNYNFPALRLVLYGGNGCGKTLSLMHIVHYGYEAKFLLLHVPWVSNWTKRPKEKVESLTRPGRVDFPIESVIWLQHFKYQNKELLEHLDLRTSKTYTWSKWETTEEGKPLIDVLEHGLARGPHASDCVAVLLKEIKLHSASGKFKTLVIIDGVNAFYNKTNVPRPDKTLVKGTDLTIVHAFEKMLKNDWNNAAVVVSVDAIPFDRENHLSVPYTPRALLGKEGFEVLDPFIPIHVGNYTEKEVESVLDYYSDRLWIQDETARQERGRAELKFLSGRNPLSLVRITDSL